jgi:hypothetical protein
MVPRLGGCLSATQNGLEAKRVSTSESELMTLNKNQSLECILESAVVVSWADLMRGAQTGLIHIEYGVRSGGHFGLPEVLVIHNPRSLACGL